VTNISRSCKLTSYRLRDSYYLRAGLATLTRSQHITESGAG